MWRVRRMAARLPKSAAIPYPGASRTNHKSAVRYLIKKWCTNFTNCCITILPIHAHMHTRTCTHMHTRTRTHTHTRTHAYMHTHTCTHAHAHTCTHAHAHMHARTCAHMHTCTRTHTHTTMKLKAEQSK